MLRKGLKDSNSSAILLKVCNNLYAEIKARETRGKAGNVHTGPLKNLVEDFIAKKGSQPPKGGAGSPKHRGSSPSRKAVEEVTSVKSTAI